jgi:hypothetical protein
MEITSVCLLIGVILIFFIVGSHNSSESEAKLAVAKEKERAALKRIAELVAAPVPPALAAPPTEQRTEPVAQATDKFPKQKRKQPKKKANKQISYAKHTAYISMVSSHTEYGTDWVSLRFHDKEGKILVGRLNPNDKTGQTIKGIIKASCVRGSTARLHWHGTSKYECGAAWCGKVSLVPALLLTEIKNARDYEAMGALTLEK